MPQSKANARFSYERSRKGKVVRLYATTPIRLGEEIYIFYGLVALDSICSWVHLTFGSTNFRFDPADLAPPHLKCEKGF